MLTKEMNPVQDQNLALAIRKCWTVNGLRLPQGLISRISQNQWVSPQSLKGIQDLVIENYPFENDPSLLFEQLDEFCPYSFKSMELETRGCYQWRDEYWATERVKMLGREDETVFPGNIIPEKSILIADFGLGSDCPIVLDYRNGLNDPTVLILYWNNYPDFENRFKKIAGNFAEFEMKVWGNTTQP